VAPPSSRTAETEEQRLARLERLHGEFLATVAHEIRDPMTSCIGFAEMLLRKGDQMTPAEREEALRTIAKTGRRLVQLLEDVLDVTRLEGGSDPFVMRPQDVNEIVSEVLEERRGQPGAVDVRFDPGEGIHVVADRDRLHQVIANLVSNALKFSLGRAPVRVATRAGDGEAVIAVQDRGIGINREDVPKLFGRFVRIAQPGVEQRIPGTGLGLHISKTIVDAHRGRMWVETEPGEGSTFFVALPIATAEA
jgi:signal transduction histidine kinase